MSNTFYIPKYKAELVQWLGQRYPGKEAEFKRWSKARLYAVYYRLRNAER